jgi:predicted ArsR family transcriptional regulator
MPRHSAAESARRFTATVRRLEAGWASLEEVKCAAGISIADRNVRALLARVEEAYPDRFQRGRAPREGVGRPAARYRLKPRPPRTRKDFARLALAALPSPEEVTPEEQEDLLAVRGALALLGLEP